MLQISTAIVRRGTDVLMVLQRGPDDREPYWALPGGVVETGELANEALVREVREETGQTEAGWRPTLVKVTVMS